VNVLLSKMSLISMAQDSFYSFECVLTQLGVEENTFFYGVAIVGLTPIAIFFLSVPLWAVLTWCKQRELERRKRDSFMVTQLTVFDEMSKTMKLPEAFENKPVVSNPAVRRSGGKTNSQYSSIYEAGGEFSFLDKLMTTGFVIVMLWLPSIITSSFSVFMCTIYEGSRSFLKKDMSVECWTPEHLKMSFLVGFTFILIWAIIFPIVIDFILYKSRALFEKTRHLRLYGIFYIGLNDDAYYWEIRVVSLRKISLILSAALIA
jgi:hypothetical protein